MYRPVFISIFLSLTVIMSCSEPPKNDDSKLEFRSVSLVEIVEEVEPPHSDVASSFTSLEEWLFGICDAERPDTFIAIFKVGLFDSKKDGNMIYLAGVNRFDKGDTSFVSIDFEPSNMYFQLPHSQYSGLNRDQLLDRLTEQLKKFTETDKFKNSFLATANIILLEPDDRTIWMNNKISVR